MGDLASNLVGSITTPDILRLGGWGLHIISLSYNVHEFEMTIVSESGDFS